MTEERPFTVFIVDDEPSVLRSLSILLRAHGHIVEAFDSPVTFMEAITPGSDGCALLDVRMPAMSGLELQGWLTKKGIRLPVIMLTGHGDVALAVRAMKAGALDFIEKPARERELLAALEEARAVAASRPRPSIPPDVVEERLSRLTAREREVLDQLVLGKTNKEIAGALGISQRTIEIHRARVREKMEARGLADLITMLL